MATDFQSGKSPHSELDTELSFFDMILAAA